MFEALNLSKSYNGTVALDQLNLTIQAGEIFCLLGANGAGKTATISLFLNFIPPSSGTARNMKPMAKFFEIPNVDSIVRCVFRALGRSVPSHEPVPCVSRFKCAQGRLWKRRAHHVGLAVRNLRGLQGRISFCGGQLLKGRIGKSGRKQTEDCPSARRSKTIALSKMREHGLR